MTDAKLLSFLAAINAMDKELVDLRTLVKVVSIAASCPAYFVFLLC